MCGRFTLRTPAHIIAKYFNVSAESTRQLALRWNIAPTQEIAVVRQTESARDLTTMRWGLIPSWATDPKIGYKMINARSETVAEKPSFRSAMKQRRCLIPADGFYEWQKVGTKKQPYYIHRPDGQPFAFAGLWERWDGGPAIESCTIVTTEANRALSTLHDRMPVILAPNDYADWLDRSIEEPIALQHLLAPAADDELIAEPVSTHVNNVRNDDPTCIEPLG